jgi:hypothetical protein
LIRHDHQTPVPQALRARVHLPLLQPHNLFDRLNLHIVQQRLSRRLTNVEEFSSKREDTVVVATDDGESGDGEGFGGVSFGEDEGALGTVLGAGVVGVFELDETGDADGERDGRRPESGEGEDGRSVS